MKSIKESPTEKKQRAGKVARALAKAYPEARTALAHDNPGGYTPDLAKALAATEEGFAAVQAQLQGGART